MSTTAENEGFSSKKEMTPPAKYLNISIQLIVLILVAYIVTRTVNHVGVVLFTWHPVLVSIGVSTAVTDIFGGTTWWIHVFICIFQYLILMSHAILTMADNNFLTQSLKYQHRVTVHWILQTSALILITIAQTCIYLNKDRLGKEHYQTTHSLFGLTTYLLTVLTSIGGVGAKYSFQIKKFVKPVVIKIIHSFAGLLTYLLAVVTIGLGINQFWDQPSDSWTKPIVYVLLAFTTLYVTVKSFILFSSRVSNSMSRSNL